MSDMLNEVLNSLYGSLQVKHLEWGLPPIDKKAFDQLRPVPTNPATPGFGGDVTHYTTEGV
jgi:hypothetical protein